MIKIEQVTKKFNAGTANEVVALKGVNLQINAGEYVVLIGTNGSGKSTLLNTIAGAEFVDSGKVSIDSTDVTKLPDYKRSRWLARVMQNPLAGTAPDLSILDNFRLAALRTKSKGLKIGTDAAFKSEVKERIAHLGMGLENKLEQNMGTLSGGQRQALTIVMSAMDDPKIILLDEPTAALDPQSAETVMQLVEQIRAEFGVTVILVTHNMRHAHKFGNRLVLMHKGNVQKDLNAAQKAALSVNDIFDWF